MDKDWIETIKEQITEEDIDAIPDYLKFKATLYDDNGNELFNWVRNIKFKLQFNYSREKMEQIQYQIWYEVSSSKRNFN